MSHPIDIQNAIEMLVNNGYSVTPLSVPAPVKIRKMHYIGKHWSTKTGQEQFHYYFECSKSIDSQLSNLQRVMEAELNGEGGYNFREHRELLAEKVMREEKFQWTDELVKELILDMIEDSENNEWAIEKEIVQFQQFKQRKASARSKNFLQFRKHHTAPQSAAPDAYLYCNLVYKKREGGNYCPDTHVETMGAYVSEDFLIKSGATPVTSPTLSELEFAEKVLNRVYQELLSVENIYGFPFANFQKSVLHDEMNNLTELIKKAKQQP